MPILDTTLFIDLETDAKGTRIHEVGACYGQGEKREAKADGILPWLNDARIIAGHNILRHDAPLLRKRYGDDLLKGKHLLDTLCWSALLFADRPYHKLVKGYKLHDPDGENNPLTDAKLCRQLCDELLGAFAHLPVPMQAIYYGLLAHEPGYAGFFLLAEYGPAPATEVVELIRTQFANAICKTADLPLLARNHAVELAHALALIATTDGASILPGWVIAQLPHTEEVLHTLRFTPCGDRACVHCNEALDPQRGLKEIFGYESFRRFDNEAGIGIQEKAVYQALAGGSLLTVFPTGGGKSLTFQLPALMQGERTRGLTVVVSPLVSLMKDQVDVLEDRFHNVQAAHLSGLLSPLERKEVLERVEQGGVHLLYVAPESLRSPTLTKLLRKRQIARFVVDEAHCVSSWGHDFRVDYLFIAPFIKQLQVDKGLHRPIPVSCFTATAKPQVIADIRDYFHKELGLDLKLFISHARRENLAYKVVNLPDTDPKTRIRGLLQLLQTCEKPAIVYASRTKRIEELAAHIEATGLRVKGFHGRMKRDVKQANQDAFMSGQVDVMVATSAFGMGVDKEDVRSVIHYNISASLENYIQEAGRAGRKKEINANCYILYNEEDLGGHFQLLQRSKLNQKEVDQIWRALKGMTRFRSRISKSAKELAAAAGWDHEIRNIQNKVTASLAVLEQCGYLKRTLNSPQVFATGRLTKDIEAALRIVRGSERITEKQKEDCARVLQRIIKENETRVDELAAHLGMKLRQAVDTVQHLRCLKILNDHQDLSAFLDLRPQKGARARCTRILKAEQALLSVLDGTTTKVSIRALNDAINGHGTATDPMEVHALLNYWKRRGFIRTRRLNRQENTYRVEFRTEREEIGREMEARHALAISCLDHLLLHVGDVSIISDKEKEETLVQFSLIGLQEQLKQGMFGKDHDLKALEKALLYLHETKAITLEDGFMVIYQRLNVERMEQDNRKRFTKEDYAPLELHYGNRVEQIHMVGEYARKRTESMQAAVGYVDDYFKLEHADFIRRYFPNRRTEITRPLTAERFKKLVGELDTAQAAVVSDPSDHMLVAAGPGSGKTRVLVHKVASLLLLEGIKPEQFLMLTFSKSAALELRSRIHAFVPEHRGMLRITTFHGLCFDLMGQMGDLERSETVIDRTIAAIDGNEVDISALTNKSVIVLDEFQDVDAKQWQLVQLIAKKAGGARIIAVGDDDQIIYEWRGASARFMAELQAKPNSKTHSLLTNYRSKGSLVALTNQLALGLHGRVKHNEILTAHDPRTGLQRVVEYTDGFHLQGLAEDVAASAYTGTTAVLTRTNNEAIMATSLLQRLGIQARHVGGSDDFEVGKLRELQLFLSMLRKVHPGAGLVPKEIWMRVGVAFEETLLESPLRQDLKDLLTLFDEKHPDRYDPADWTAFMREIKISDAIRPDQGTVLVSTMHKSKGKEFDNVFILLDGKYPEDDAERRLRYVACTRAKERLAIHTKVPFLQGYTSSSLERVACATVHPPPQELHLVLGMKDIHLGSCAYNASRITTLRTGDALAPDTTHFPNNDAPGMGVANGHVVIFSKKFIAEQLPRFEKLGYAITGGSAEYIAEWFDKEKERTYEVVLPRIVLQRVN